MAAQIDLTNVCAAFAAGIQASIDEALQTPNNKPIKRNYDIRAQILANAEVLDGLLPNHSQMKYDEYSRKPPLSLLVISAGPGFVAVVQSALDEKYAIAEFIKGDKAESVDQALDNLLHVTTAMLAIFSNLREGHQEHRIWRNVGPGGFWEYEK